MVEVKVDVNDLMTGEIKKIKQELAKVPRQGLAEFRSLTPIRSGPNDQSVYRLSRNNF